VSTEPLDELYFTWLYSKVEQVENANPSRTYWHILRILYTKEFLWFVPNDDNRAEDAKGLRYEFINEEGLEDVDPHWLALGCSMLELMIGLSRRLAFETEGEPDTWFWVLMENLDLERYNDSAFIPEQEVDDTLMDVIWRTYKPNGVGGLFPLRKPHDDQREVELWYQLSAYVLEQENY
jgi:hypothetical protein